MDNSNDNKQGKFNIKKLLGSSFRLIERDDNGTFTILEKALIGLVITLLAFIIALIVFRTAISPLTKKAASITDDTYNSYSHEDDFKRNVYGEEQTKNMENEEVKIVDLPSVSCWGDSFTIAPNAQTASYPAYIAKYIQSLIFNIATNRDNIEMLAARQGGLPMIMSPCDIPARKSIVEITLTNEYGTDLTPDFSKNGGLNPVTVNGIEGMITSIDNKLYFSRSVSGNEEFIYTPTTVTTRAMSIRNKDTTVIFIGDVEKLESKERMLEIYKKMVGFLQTDKYLIIGPVKGNNAKVNEYNKALSEAFGNKYLDLHSYILSDKFVTDNNFKLDDKNKQMAKNGQIPNAYLVDATHFNSDAARAIGKRIAQKFLELKYVNKLYL